MGYVYLVKHQISSTSSEQNEMIFYFAYAAAFLAILYYFYTRSYNYWKSKGIAYDEPFFIFGSFYKIFTGKQHIFYKVKEIYDSFPNLPYVGIYVFNQPQLLVRSPELLKKILVRDFDKFVDHSFSSNEAADPLAYHSLFGAEGSIWKNLRMKISPVFTSGKIKLMLPLMKECAEDLKDNLTRHVGETVDFRKVTKKYAVDIISSCAFGIHAHCLKSEEDSEIFKVSTSLLDVTSIKRCFSVFSFFFVPKFVDWFRLTFLDQKSSDRLVGIFMNALKQRDEKNIIRNDLIDLLNNLKKAETGFDNYTFTDTTMAAQAIQFFSAGNDTTSLTISYALYELALNPQIQDRLRTEIQEVYKKHGDLTYEAMQEMKYLDMVLNEALRKYPLTTFIDRKSIDRYTFEETGLTLDKGSTILVPVVGLHFDPEYFPKPDKFDPERFSDENKKNIVPYTFMPFGEGPRNCIGQRFGILVSKIALANVVKNFELKPCAITPIPLKFNSASMFLQNLEGVPLKVCKA